MGTIATAGLANEDSPWNHSCSQCSVFDAIGEIIGKGSCFDGVDWCIHLIPDPEFTHLLGNDTRAGSPRRLQIQQKLEIEYEWCLLGWPTPIYSNDPAGGVKEKFKGNKLFVAGRWISDCGCHPFSLKPWNWPSNCSDRYKSEIHPPAIMIRMYTDTRNAGQPVTIGELIYLDWWYPNEMVEVDIYPPPRPKPDVLPKFSIPIWKDICPSDGGKCGIQYSLEPKEAPNHIHLKISGRPDIPSQTPPIELGGNGQLHHGPRGSPYIGSHAQSLWGTLKAYYDTLPAPTQLSPANGTVFSHYPRETTLKWTPVPGTAHYAIEIQSRLPYKFILPYPTGTSAWTLYKQESDIKTTSYIFHFGGAQPGRWRVWAVDAAGRGGVKSPWREFRYLR